MNKNVRQPNTGFTVPELKSFYREWENVCEYIRNNTTKEWRERCVLSCSYKESSYKEK